MRIEPRTNSANRCSLVVCIAKRILFSGRPRCAWNSLVYFVIYPQRPWPQFSLSRGCHPSTEAKLEKGFEIFLAGVSKVRGAGGRTQPGTPRGGMRLH